MHVKEEKKRQTNGNRYSGHIEKGKWDDKQNQASDDRSDLGWGEAAFIHGDRASKSFVISGWCGARGQSLRCDSSRPDS